MLSLALSPEVVDELTALARARADREACGFLLGRGRVVVAVAPTRNACASAGEFAIADAEVHRIAALARSRQLAVLAVFHSHPSGALGLSPEDVAMLAQSPLPWIVCTRDAIAGWTPGVPPVVLAVRCL